MSKDYLETKTKSYQEKLSEAIQSIEIKSSDEKATEFIEMAMAYLADGEHFLEHDNEPDALAAFSYGHAWLDAGMRLGFYETDREELFAADNK